MSALMRILRPGRLGYCIRMGLSLRSAEHSFPSLAVAAQRRNSTSSAVRIKSGRASTANPPSILERIAEELQSEPDFVRTSEGRYERPLLGSEAHFQQLHRDHEGVAEACLGVTFSSPLSLESLVTRIENALLRLRFECPLIASEIRDDHGRLTWSYEPPDSIGALSSWVRNTLTVHSDARSGEDLVLELNQTRLPYNHSNGRSQYLGVHLVCEEEPHKYSLVFHATHAILDALPSLRALALLLRAVTDYSDALSAELLEWGTEWQRLPPGPVRASGGLKPGFHEHGLDSLQRFGRMVFNPTPTHGLRTQRTDITIKHRPLKLHRKLDEHVLSSVLSNLKVTNHKIGLLLEAAQALATFRYNPVLAKEVPLQDAHVTFDSTIVSLENFLVPPYDSRIHMTSAFVYIALTVPFTSVPWLDSEKTQLLHVMTCLQKQYNSWLRDPHLPFSMAAANFMPPIETPITPGNPNAGVITNLGVVERRLPTTFRDSIGAVIIDIDQLLAGHRWSVPRECTHTWTMKDELHIQVQASDVWDKDYMDGYLDEMVRLIMLFCDSEM